MPSADGASGRRRSIGTVAAFGPRAAALLACASLVLAFAVGCAGGRGAAGEGAEAGGRAAADEGAADEGGRGSESALPAFTPQSGGAAVMVARWMGEVASYSFTLARRPVDAALEELADPSVTERRAQAAREQSGHSYHTTGAIVSIDRATESFILSVTESTDDLLFGDRVTVACRSAEHFDVPFNQLEEGARVQVRATAPCEQGAVAAQKVFMTETR